MFVGPKRNEDVQRTGSIFGFQMHYGTSETTQNEWDFENPYQLTQKQELSI